MGEISNNEPKIRWLSLDDNEERLVFKLEIWEKYQKINRESKQQGPEKIIDTPHTEKQEQYNRNEQQINYNRKNTHLNHREQTLTEEKKMIMENLKGIMSEKKARSQHLINQDCRTV